MSDHHKLSLRSAILINLNVMVGFGIFVNTVILAKTAGFLGFVCYALVALLIFPLILSIATLMRIHPSGGFYTYGAQEISPLAGFLSAWVYFTGKLASATLIIHVVMTLLQSLIPVLQKVPTLFLDIFVIVLFTLLNTFHMKVGSRVAGIFIILKLTPIFFAIVCGLYLLSGATIPADSFLWSGIPSSIPFVLYAFTGFEACCSLSKSIENSEKNGPKAILFSFALAVIINVAYQLLFFTATGGALMTQESYLNAFPTLLNALFNDPIKVSQGVSMLHLALGTAALGGSYAILFSNHWNLYTLAQHNHTFFSSVLTKLNKNQIPVACILAETVLCIFYLVVTQGSQAPLQQINALACTIAYTISVLALIQALKKSSSPHTRMYVPLCALASCTLFIAACIRNFILNGASSLIAFSAIITFGLFMYWYQSTHLERQQSNQA
jgi:amino acid transporter